MANTGKKKPQQTSPATAGPRCSRSDAASPDRLSARGGEGLDADEVAMVRRSSIAPLLVCGLCGGILREATTVSECLHTFCGKCIHEKFKDEDDKRCPTCNIDLGCDPKLRADRSLRCISSVIFPAKRKMEEFSSLHPESVSLPSLTTQASEAYRSGYKMYAHLVGDPMNITAEGRTALSPVASQNEAENIGNENTARILEMIEVYIGQIQASEVKTARRREEVESKSAKRPAACERAIILEDGLQREFETLIDSYTGRTETLEADNARLRQELENERADKATVGQLFWDMQDLGSSAEGGDATHSGTSEAGASTAKTPLALTSSASPSKAGPSVEVGGLGFVRHGNESGAGPSQRLSGGMPETINLESDEEEEGVQRVPRRRANPNADFESRVRHVRQRPDGCYVFVEQDAESSQLDKNVVNTSHERKRCFESISSIIEQRDDLLVAVDRYKETLGKMQAEKEQLEQDSRDQSLQIGRLMREKKDLEDKVTFFVGENTEFNAKMREAQEQALVEKVRANKLESIVKVLKHNSAKHLKSQVELHADRCESILDGLKPVLTLYAGSEPEDEAAQLVQSYLVNQCVGAWLQFKNFDQEAVQEVSQIVASDVLAIVKSHYPAVDLRRPERGFTKDVGEGPANELCEEAKDAANAMVNDIHFCMEAEEEDTP